QTDPSADELHRLRRKLESQHQLTGSHVTDDVWPYLGHDDRHIRFAARIVLEHQPVELWQERALTDTRPQNLITAAVALARTAGSGSSADDKETEQTDTAERLISALEKLSPKSLSVPLRLQYLRAISLTIIRLGSPTVATRRRLSNHLRTLFPSGHPSVDRELCRLLVYLDPVGAIAPTLDLLGNPDSSEDQIHFAAMLRNVREGWTIDSRQA
ncbi:MAG: hypothetical protein GY758_22285, partial [Fuerstiella sp.]|nr:hypothetical protein [Fuerstiella sp.]